MNISFIVKCIAMATVLTAAGLLASCEQAVGKNAEVISVQATMKTVTVAREECHDEVVTLKHEVKDSNRITGTVTGAVIGGVVGNQVGGGSGQDIATVGGAVAGGYAGNQVQKGMQDRNTYEEVQRVCAMVNTTEEVPSGYDVTYMLNGQQSMVHLDYDPGNQIAVVDGQLAPRQ
ncbi:MAG: glycine zipper 2TM domain-containing protein [Pseudomonadales bacterium]